MRPTPCPPGAADLAADSASLALPDGMGRVPLARSLSDVLGDADVVVDVTTADGALAAIRTAAPRGIGVVIGSSGVPDSTVGEARVLAERHSVGIVVVPNFAVGAVLMTHLARVAARFFEYADLIETHHERKIDAPSGTAMAIARAVVEGRGGPLKAPVPGKETIPGTRGGEIGGVTIHSARLPGRVANHELVFAAPGPDPYHAPRVDRSLQLHAGRNRRCPGSGERPGTDRWFGTGTGSALVRRTGP